MGWHRSVRQSRLPRLTGPRRSQPLPVTSPQVGVDRRRRSSRPLCICRAPAFKSKTRVWSKSARETAPNPLSRPRQGDRRRVHRRHHRGERGARRREEREHAVGHELVRAVGHVQRAPGRRGGEGRRPGHFGGHHWRHELLAGGHAGDGWPAPTARAGRAGPVPYRHGGHGHGGHLTAPLSGTWLARNAEAPADTGADLH